ncbi:hypothetical protein CcaCcLH18_07077 [Colletotrichum camelliae]|nr:hypothetical protein CcaCcLH18_07077 [Colletotrichum camelliae]
MQDNIPPDRPPVTQLRPLHTLNETGDIPPSAHLTWTSSVRKPVSEVLAVQAFIRLVSLVSIVEPGDSFCIQDAARGGYVCARVCDDFRAGCHSFYPHGDDRGDIPTDFSIGPGKALQLHVTNSQIQLVVQASIVPPPALDALGRMLEDIILGSNEANGKLAIQWTQPSVLNFPPREKPVFQGQLTQPILLHHWFEQRVMDHPQRVALDYLIDLETGQTAQYTYKQLSIAATALSAKLHRASSESSAAVKTAAVAIGPSPELYISYLAALKAGLGFCPIPVDAPRERIERILAELKPVAVLVEKEFAGFTTAVETVSVNTFLGECDVEPESLPVNTTSETDAAYILYTSGTTGMPKGVIVSHISAACTISALGNHYGFCTPDKPTDRPVRWFQGAAPTFDISLFEIFWTLSTGSTLCCAPRDLTMKNVDRVVTTLKADITNVTPSFASLIDPSSLRGLMVGGETVNARLLQDFSHHNPVDKDIPTEVPQGIYNGYGPTEVTIYSVAQAHVPANQRGSVIGTPLSTCGVLIVDEQARGLRPVPMGAVGQLILTGPQVSKAGYLDRAEETSKSFVDDAEWGRAYKTGDRARIVWDEHDQPVVEFLGRMNDDQVKLSGRRVELGEVESVLASRVASVRQTVACVWKPHDAILGSERIVSLVVVDPESTVDFSTVRSQCVEAARHYLPEYMRPFRIFQVDTLPRSSSGKIDRKAALAHVRDRLQQFPDDNTPTKPEEHILENAQDAKLEAELVDILSAIVNSDSSTVSPVTATTLLVHVGLDSLRAMRLLRDIRRKWPDSKHMQPSLGSLLDPGASIRSVFFMSAPGENRSLAGIESKAKAQQRINSFASHQMKQALAKLGSVGEAEVEMVLPATGTQSQLAVSFAMDRHNYISHMVLPLETNVVPETLEKAVNAVFERHAIYRCAFAPCDDDLSSFAQVILRPDAWRRWTESDPRIVRRRGRAADDAQQWLDAAHQYLELDSQRLYLVQVIHEDEEGPELGTGLLVISMAHCLCDGPSLEVLRDDISREYAGLDPLPRLSIQDAVLDWISSLNAETDKYWQESLKGWESESFHALSGNNVKSPAPGVPVDYGHAMVQFASDLPWHQLEAKSRDLGASPLSILQAAWSLLLKIFSEANTNDIVFGSVLSGQREAIHAPTFSVVPCRVPMFDQQTVRELTDFLVNSARLAQGRRNPRFGIFETLPYNTALALQAYVPPETGFGQLNNVDAVAVPWTEVRSPAIRYDFDIFAEVLPTDLTTSGSQANMVSFKITYRDHVLSETSAKVIVRQFAALTRELMSSRADDIVHALPARLPRDLLSAEGTIPVPTEEPVEEMDRMKERVDVLHAQFERQAEATPDLLALSFYASLDASPIDLTYAELDARANGLASVLREEDAEVIPICMQRSVELYVAVLAILKAGSAWSPIDETSPIQRRTSLIARTQGKVLLTTTDSYHLVEPCLGHESLRGVRVLFVDQYADQKESARPEPRRCIQSLRSAIGGQDLAYLLWTSGTTGEPKGVMIQHHAAANAMRDLQVQVEHDEKTGQVRTLQLSAYSFNVFVQDLFYTWGMAGSVISGTREIVLGTFTEFVRTAHPTHAHLTPSFGASIDVEDLAGSTLRYVTFIGEKLTEDVAEAWAAPEITARAYNTYGPAENAVVSTMRRFFGKSRDRSKAANVGFPLTPCTAYVVRQVADPRDGDVQRKRWELVPRYGVGELALGGAQVAKGYLNNEAKTTAAFIQGGHGIDERIYLTGDMVRLNDHGFEFLGRNDDLVKITGIRIELSEISAACAIVKDDEPAVEHVETLYLPRPGQIGGDASHKVIVTFVSVKRKSVDTDKIRTQVFQKARDVLPAYMVPGHVVVLNTTMPRTASNKVDRKALQSIYNASDLTILAGRRGSATIEAKWPDDQVAVLTAVAESFGVPLEPLDPNDSLAGLGFSSLQITKSAWTLRRQMKCAVGVLDLMRCQTLGELVGVVMQSIEQSRASEILTEQDPATCSWLSTLKEKLTNSLHGDLRPKNTSYILPATPVQESLLVETMIEPGAYWSHRIFDLGHLGGVDTARLKAAWTAAASHVDILRTAFCPLSHFSVRDDNLKSWSSGQWAREHGIYAAVLQLVLDTPYVHWTTLHKADAETLADLAKQIQLELAPLGASRARPPWTVTFSEGNSKMMLSMHHALHDAESSSMLLDMVARLYRDPQQSVSINSTALQMARGMELGLLPSMSQRNEACSAWRKRLHGLVETDGALNSPFPDLTGSRQKSTRTILSAKASVPSHLLEARRTGLPDLPRLMQSAFGCILAAVLELRTVVLGQTVSQRVLHPDLARVVGPAMATLPVIIRAHVSTATELWAEMNRDASSLGAIAHSLHPVDVKKMINEGSGESNAPFPALFVYHPIPEAGEGVVDAGRAVFKEVGQALSLNVEHPMALNIFEVDNTVELTGDSRVISQAMLQLMLHQILKQARVMLENPNAPLNQLQNYMDRELVAIVGEPATFVGKDIATNPAALVTKQATEHPEWIAVEEIFLDDEDDGSDRITTETLTYRELEVLVNVIASKLTSHEANLQPGDVFALYLERDIKSLAAIIAIFKCGYIYLPIDEGLPSARKQLLVHDANAKLVVTTEDMVANLDLLPARDPPALFLPQGDDELEVLRSWSDTVSGSATNTGADGGYLLYTSGSTGRPKRVQVTNESLLHWISAMTKCLIKANAEMADLGGVGKYLNVASRAFDTHLTSMFAPWHLGFRSVIGKDRDGIFGSLQQVVNTVGITNMGSVSFVLLQLGLRLADMPSMRILTIGGEKASHELFEQLTAGNPKAALMNFYGPTEATVGCLSHVVGYHSNARNLGLPLPGLQALLLVPGDGDEQVVARKGEPGEFCIAGPQVAVGYLDRPEENAKAFQYTTLLGGARRRIYRTGDMMRMMHDGTVEFLGRKDQQTKIRGQRFEIGEVEAYIKKVVADQGPLDVAAAVVDQRLLGFLARRRNTLLKAEVDAEPELISQPSQALRAVLEVIEQACQRELPAFMVPEIMWVSKIQLLAASGKTDAKLLVKLGHDFFNVLQGSDATSSLSKAAPTTLTEAEREVLAALEEVMGKQVVATPASIIRNLGIDSLSGMHLLSALKKRGFVKVSLANLLSPSCSVGSLGSAADVNVAFAHAPTNASLPAKEMTLKDLGPGANGLTEDAITAILPCLPLQSSLVALSLNWLQSDDEAAGVDPPYVTEFNYEFAPGTDIARWQQVAEQIVSSEAMLRTCFVQREQDGRIFQVVLKSPPSPFEGHDDAAAIVLQISSRPPVRLQITDNPSPGKTTVSLKIHHALYDGAAITMFRNKIGRAYARDYMPVLSDQQSLSTLQRLAIHCDLTHQEMKAIESSWKTNLLGVQPCRVGAGVGESKQATTNRAARRLAYTAAELKTKLQRKDGETVSLSTALQLATTLCLASLTRSRCIVYGFTMSLRPLLSHVAEGINDFVGPCLNTIVHASIMTSAHETLPQLIKRISRSHADSCQGKMPLVGVDKIQRWAGVEEKLFDSLLTINVLPTDDELAGRDDLPGSMNSLPGKANIDMALTVDIDLHPNGKIDLALASAGVLTAAQLEGLAALFEEIVVNSANNAATVGQFASGVSCEAPQVRVISTPIPNGEPAQLGSQSIDDSFQVALSGVRDIACRLLSLDKANVDGSTSLYRLGLDSINVLSFVKLINKSEAIKITASAVLRARTLQGVAELVHKAKSRSHKEGCTNGELTRGTQSVDLQRPYEQTLLRVASDLLFIATPLQEGMLSASMAFADQAYVYTHTMRLSDAAREQDAPRFERFSAAVRDVVQACEILRARFMFTNDDDAPWVGVVSPTEQSDLLNWKISENGLVQLKIHHALYDANSIRAIWRLLNDNYAKRLAGHQQDQDELEPTKYLFRPFARLSAAAQRSSIAFWVDTVQDYAYTPIEFSVDAKHASSAFYFSLSKAELSILQAKCREAQVSPKAAMQVAWAKLLCEIIYEQADVVFGEVITASQDDDDNVVMGPTINTIPLRLKFSSQMGAASIGEALSLLQTLSDNARGENGRASLRAIQTAWRSSRTDGVDTSAGIFQSLFVYDGILSSADDESPKGPLVPAGAREQADAGEGEKSPAYDDYPLMVSFRIRDGELHGALRTKMSEAETNRLGTQLEAALRYVVSQDLQDPALGSHLRLGDFTRKEERTGAKTAVDRYSHLAELKSLQDQAVDIVKKAVGSKFKGRKMALDTKLINVGLDSISAIRFSKMLRKQMGIHMSVFEIIRGASVYDIVTKSTSRETHGVVNRRNEKAPLPDGSLKGAAAGSLGVAEDQIKTVSPVLSGQRGTLRQWLHSGKRFFEAPWAYRIDDVSVDERAVASNWESLCQTHEILRTTFVCTGGSAELVQVTFDGQVSVASRLTTVRDATISLQELIQEHVRQGNAEPSDFTRPPARFSFIEALDGKDVVLRVHHALYDAWSIKMIQKDLVSLFDGQPLGPRPSVQSAIKQIIALRQPEAEQEYWTQHLTGAADTILESGVKPANGSKNPLRSHSRSQFADVLPQDTVDSLTLANKSRTQVSVAAIVAYARALGRLTGRSRPTFGFNYSSRSLSSATGEQTLDLTSMSIPTMTVVPFSLDLETTPEQGLLEAVRNHLAQLARFAQADDLDKISPRHTLQRLKLGEPLASEYFTKAAPSLTSSPVDILDTSFMPNQQLYFNVLVRQNGNINLDMSGEEGLLSGDQDLISRLVEGFSADLVEAMRVEGDA